MKKVRLGKTGLMVSRVGMGGIPITRPREDEAIKVLRRAHGIGVTFFDSATGYGLGESEKRIGKALKYCRGDVVIATKTGATDEKGASRALKRSLRQLDTDYVDLWQLGNVTTFDKYERLRGPNGALKAAREALRTGVARHIGLSTHSMAVALEAVSSGLFETVQFPFNLIADEAADELIPLAEEHDVGFIAMKPFAAGLIKDANLAIKFLLQYDNVVSDPGIETVEELEEIVGIVNGPRGLTTQERQMIGEIHEKMNNRFCRHCEECLPCPRGVYIPQLIYLTAAYNLRSGEWFRDGLDEEVESWEQCDLCGDCEEKCPHGLPVREMIQENIDFYEALTSGGR
ncbi:aldo/keto reductase [Candidatus Bathyarchaeota archaeon]|nr:aldo/keto reductase [Candidatus Bathyarchaeota archaeon]